VRAWRARFDPATRNVFDLTAVPLVHNLSHLPIIGRSQPRDRTARQGDADGAARAVAAGADGLLSRCIRIPKKRKR